MDIVSLSTVTVCNNPVKHADAAYLNTCFGYLIFKT